MCTRVTCRRCGKPTYSGCGRHVEQVLAGVAPERRCRCRENQRTVRNKGGGLLRRLLGL